MPRRKSMRRRSDASKARAKESQSKIFSPPKVRMSSFPRTIGVFPTRKRALTSKARVNRVLDRSQQTLKVSPSRDGKHHVLEIKTVSLE